MTSFFVKIILFLLIIPPIQAELYNYKILRVVDGDTVLIEAPYLPNPLKKTILLRIAKLDTPEKNFRAHCSLEATLGNSATEFTTNKIKDAKNILVSIEGEDKYFRLLGDVILDGISLRSLLLESGLATPYYGNKKPDWCNSE